jgi:hypothetical protein
MGERELVWYVSGTYTDPPEMWDADPAEVLAEIGVDAVREWLQNQGWEVNRHLTHYVRPEGGE